MISEVDDGTQTSVISTEHILSTQTARRTHVLVVDLNEMALGDAVTLRAYSKVLAGSTRRIAATATFTGAQAEPVFYTIPIPSAHEVRFTLEQTAGTARDYDWSLLTLD